MGWDVRGLSIAWAIAAACAPAERPATEQPREVPPALAQADAAYERGDQATAAVLYDQAIGQGLGREHARAYARRAELYRKRGDIEGGLAFVRLQVDSPGWREPQIDDEKVALLLEAGQPEQAHELAAATFAAEPRAYHSAFLLCTTTPVNGAACQAFLESRPDRDAKRDRLVLIHLANWQLQQRNGGAAAHAALALRRRFPDDRIARLNADYALCAAHVLVGRFTEAIEACGRVLDEPDPGGSVHYNLCQAYLETGRIDDAREQAELFAARTPRPQRAARLFERLARIDGRDFDPGQLRARRGGALDSGRAQQALARSDYGAAAAFARAHITAYPWDAAGWYFLARVRWAQGRYLAAVATWAIARRPALGPRVVESAESGTDFVSSLLAE